MKMLNDATSNLSGLKWLAFIFLAEYSLDEWFISVLEV